MVLHKVDLVQDVVLGQNVEDVQNEDGLLDVEVLEIEDRHDVGR